MKSGRTHILSMKSSRTLLSVESSGVRWAGLDSECLPSSVSSDTKMLAIVGGFCEEENNNPWYYLCNTI